MIIFIQTLLMIITFGQFSLYNITYVDRTIDTPIAELNNYTLREVFEDGNIVVNASFSNGTNGWLGFGIGETVIDGRLYYDGTSQYGIVYQTPPLITLNTYYVKYDYELISGSVGFNAGGQQPTNDVTIIGIGSYSKKYTTSSANNGNAVFGSAINYSQAYYDNILLIDLTTLGITTLTVEDMDSYFNEYLELKEGSEHSYTYTINEVTLTDFMVVLSSAVIWFFIIKFLKEVF